MVGSLTEGTELVVVRVWDIHGDFVIPVPEVLDIPVDKPSCAQAVKLSIETVRLCVSSWVEDLHYVFDINLSVFHLQLKKLNQSMFHGKFSVSSLMSAAHSVNITIIKNRFKSYNTLS